MHSVCGKYRGKYVEGDGSTNDEIQIWVIMENT